MLRIAMNGRFLTQAMTGVQRYQHELLRAFDQLAGERRDLDIALICPPGAAPPPLAHIAPRTVGAGGGHRWEQVVLSQAVGNRVLFCGGNVAPLGRLLHGAPTVVTIHDLSFRMFPSAYTRRYRWWHGAMAPVILRRASAVITVSEAERAAILRYFPAAAPRLHAIANGGLPGALPVMSTATPRAADAPLLYVGSFTARKNFLNLLAAMIALAELGERVVLAGGSAAALARLGAPIPGHIADRVTVMTDISDAALRDLYARAKLLVFPSLYEASGLPPVEAMAFGTPVVVSDIPALRERCGDAAVYCNPHDPADIAASVRRVIGDPALMARLAEAGIARARQFDWRRCAELTLEVIARVTRDQAPTLVA